MTTIPEKKRDFVVIFGFMIAVALLVAWRAEHLPTDPAGELRAAVTKIVGQ